MLEEEVVEDEPEAKVLKNAEETHITATASNSSTTTELSESRKTEQPKKQLSTNSWNKSVGGISRKGGLAGLVKIKKNQENDENVVASSSQNNPVKTTSSVSNGLSLLGAYSDSDNSE